MESQNELKEVMDSLKGAFIQRNEEIDILFASLLAQEHCLLLGLPGTGKTALAEAFAAAVGLSSWSYLMTKMTTDSEVFGAPNVKKMAEEGVLQRVTTGKMPEAEAVILDEIFKANSPILNALLRILNERIFDNPYPVSVPLQICVGLSNEMPAGVELDALFDRFCLRTWVSPIKGRSSKRDLIRMTGKPSVQKSLSGEALNELRNLAASAVLGERCEGILLDIVETLEDSDIRVSDRRLRKAVKMLKAVAVMNGRQEVSPEDFGMLRYMLWTDVDTIEQVDKIVTSASDPDLDRARTILGHCKSIFSESEELVRKTNGMNPEDAFEAFGSTLTANVANLRTAIIKMKRLNNSPRVAECIEIAHGWEKEVYDESNKLLALASQY